MEHTKMYHLVEPRILENLERQQGIPDPRLTKYHKLDDDMQSLLTDNRPTTTDDETLKVYNQKLMRQRMMQDQYANHRPPVKVEVVQPSNVAANLAANVASDPASDSASGSHPPTFDDTEREIYDSVPKSMQRKAKLLIDKIKSRSDIRWNDKGELVYKRKVVPGSNIVDLVNDTMRKRKRFQPTGWEVFATGLKEANVPQELVGNPRQWDYMKKAHLSDEDSFGWSTPSASRRSTPSTQIATQKATPHWTTPDEPYGKPDGKPDREPEDEPEEKPESETREEALKELSKRWTMTTDPTTDTTTDDKSKLGKPLGKSLDKSLRTSLDKSFRTSLGKSLAKPLGKLEGTRKVIGSKRLSPYVTTPKGVQKWKTKKV